MAARDSKGADPHRQARSAGIPGAIAASVATAIRRGFVVGREVLVGNVPGIVVGYNIAGVGSFVGNAYPLVVRTALGVAKCGMDEVRLL